MPDLIPLSDLYLEPEELAVLKEIREAGVLPDTHIGEEPYSYLLRVGLIRHTLSDKFPCIHTPGNFIDMNAIELADRGRSILALQAQRDRNNAQIIAEALKKQTAEIADYRADQTADKRGERKFQLFLAGYSALIGGVVAFILGHIGDIARLVKALFQ